jgi:hypothetical protein
VRLRRSKEFVILDDYKAAIRTAYAQAKAQGAGVAGVSNCITVVAIHETAPEDAIRSAAVHTCYHLRHPKVECLLTEDDRATEELRAMQDQAPIVDVVELNFRIAHAEPIFTWNAQEMVLDLLFGRVRLFAQFDIEEFLKYAEAKLGVKCSWVTGRENQDLAKHSLVIPGSPGSRGVRVYYKGGQTRCFLSGFFARPLLQFVTPDDLVNMIRNAPTIHPDASTKN